MHRSCSSVHPVPPLCATRETCSTRAVHHKEPPTSFHIRTSGWGYVVIIKLRIRRMDRLQEPCGSPVAQTHDGRQPSSLAAESGPACQINRSHTNDMKHAGCAFTPLDDRVRKSTAKMPVCLSMQLLTDAVSGGSVTSAWIYRWDGAPSYRSPSRHFLLSRPKGAALSFLLHWFHTVQRALIAQTKGSLSK